MKLLFLDTETTGLDKEDRICQVAYKVGDQTASEMFKPPLPMKVDAMAVCHITDKMLINKPDFQGSPMWEDMNKLFQVEEIVFVAHNAVHDVKMLEKENLNPKRVICTMKIARYLDKEAIIPSHALQYLRYYLGLEVEATAHDALGDVLVMEKLFERLYEKMLKIEGGDTEVINKMIDVSSKPSLIARFAFGKYKGKKVEDLVKEDAGYLKWFLGEKMKEEEPDEDWIYTLNYFLNNKQGSF